MGTSGITPNIPIQPPTGPAGPEGGKDLEALLIAALLSMMGVSKLFLDKYMNKVGVAEKWVKWALGIKGIVDAKNAGSITNKQYQNFAEAYEALEKRLASMKPPLPPLMQTLKAILAPLKGIYDALKNLNKLENQVPIDIAAVKKAKEKVTADVKKLIQWTTPEEHNALTILRNNVNQFVTSVSTPAMVLAKQAMHMINQINNLAKYTSSMMKKVEQASEMIWRLTLAK